MRLRRSGSSYGDLVSFPFVWSSPLKGRFEWNQRWYKMRIKPPEIIVFETPSLGRCFMSEFLFIDALVNNVFIRCWCIHECYVRQVDRREQLRAGKIALRFKIRCFGKPVRYRWMPPRALNISVVRFHTALLVVLRFPQCLISSKTDRSLD